MELVWAIGGEAGDKKVLENLSRASIYQVSAGNEGFLEFLLGVPV